MESFADDGRVAALESELPSLPAAQRAHGLAELAWHLRQRDTRRASALAEEAALLAQAHAGDPHEAARVFARVGLVRAESALLSLELDAARRHATQALDAFENAGDADGASEARWLLARITRRAGRRAGGDDPLPLPRAASKAACDCHRRHADGMSFLQSGAMDRAIECFSLVALDAPAYGMHELALEAELGVARAFAMLGDAEAAIDIAQGVLSELHERGWRCFLAAVSAMLARLLLARGQPSNAVDVLEEADIALATAPAAAHDPALDYLLAEAQLHAGKLGEAMHTAARAEARFRECGLAAEASRSRSILARAAGARGDVAAALEHGALALRMGRDARARAAEMEALCALAELHARNPSTERTPRSALALLRHAAEISEEIGDREEKAAIMHRIAELHEAAGDCAAALAAERGAHAEALQACERRTADHAVAAQARWIRERHRLIRQHAQEMERTEAAKALALRETHERFERLRAAGGDIARGADPATIVEAVERELAPFMDAALVALFVFDASGRSLRRYAREAGRAIPVREIAAGDLESYAARAAREQRELVIEVRGAREADDGAAADCATQWFAPLRSGERVLGVLTIQSRRARVCDDAEKLALRTLADHAALALLHVQACQALAAQRALRVGVEEQMQRLATVDRLTGLATRPQFFALARERLERARRHGGPCGLIVADVDGFKRVNDTRGHEAGDRALAAVGRAFGEHHGPEDVAGRIGGEEFALLLPGANLQATVDLAERIRGAIEALRIACDGHPVRVTMSFGCTAIADAAVDLAAQPVDATLERLMREADAGLYEAQGTGGDRTIAWPAYQALRALRTGETLGEKPQSLA